MTRFSITLAFAKTKQHLQRAKPQAPPFKYLPMLSTIGDVTTTAR
jgi:hypothetical protein